MQSPLLWIFYALMFLQLITLIYGIRHYHRLNKPLKIITILISVSLAVGIIGTILPRLGYYSTPVINLYHLMEVSILYLFFYHSISIQIVKRGITIVYPILLVFWVVSMIKNWHTHEVLYDFSGIVTLTYILLVFAYFYEVVQNYKIVRLEHTPSFWIAAGLLMSMSGKILSFIGYSLIEDYDYLLKIWALLWIMEIIFIGFLLLAYRTHVKYERTDYI